ncbi:SurA N-terminal domain-containing protein [Aestuariirhabdus sp. Z084]|uniref:SurA N-terminal domain-containing protein n=1 Tax=Aestuariirhabdus haliotis TaxID=2918751 RepID=UPI00201B4028|nr:SurA N-terminal domain-containing protein [Aestuariirhabdus haliotis]MCL6414567.1 SurA N-terminal domain-containing protein [Aestuariirhabdus haliotis]MCL6418451.1 SurA N-terminal domain-containing protein [Aestuariirhabdus haliotis]
MLQNIRENAQGVVAKIIVGFIILTFAIFGLESISGGGSGNTAASVNGEDITQQALYQAMQMRRQQLSREMGENFNPALLDEQRIQQSSLQGLIDQTLLLQQAADLGLYFPDEAIDQMIVNTESFQVDGKFNPDQFQLALRSISLSPIQFRQMIQGEMLISQLSSGFAASNFVTPAEMEAISALERQQRDIRYITLSAETERAKVSVEAQEVQDYYDSNPGEFMAEEQVRVDYLLLNKNDLMSSVEVSEDDVANAYQAYSEQLTGAGNEQRRAAHILLEVNEENPDETVSQLANELKQRIDAGEDFAALAKEYSADAFSAQQGGDLGVVEDGFLGETFDDTLSSLEPGEVSAPVKTEFGYQLIKLLTAESVEVPALDEVREQLVREIKLDRVEPIFVEQSQLLADISFESADLQQPAEELGLTSQSTDLFGRNGSQEGLSSNPAFIAAAFAEDVLSEGANSQLIELDGDRVAVLRLAQHIKPEPRALVDVESQIRTTLVAVKAEEMLQDQALALKEKALSSGLDSIVEQEWVDQPAVSRQQPGNLAQQILLDTFKAPHPSEGVPSLLISGLPNGDKVLLAVTAVNTPEVADAELETTRNQFLSRMLSQQKGQAIFEEYRQSLLNSADIETF